MGASEQHLVESVAQSAAGPARPLRIFVNYRASDAGGYAHLLYKGLGERFGEENVFFDRVALRPGSRWLEEIRAHGLACGVFIALIGPEWARLMQERAATSGEDVCRSEIEAALRDGSRVDEVIPALVGGGVMPSEQAIPPSLARLTRRQCVELRPARWDEDVTHLIELLDEIASKPPQPAPEPTPPAVSRAQPEPPAPRPGRTHFDRVVRLMLEEGTVVPVLGPGANSSDRDTHWEDVESGHLPDAEELAKYLAQKLGLTSLPPDLARTAQYMAVDLGIGDLYRLLRRALMQRSPPSAVEQWLARLPQTLRRLGQAKPYQLILTTNYDDALERAFQDAEERYDLAVYMGRGTDKGRFVHVPFDGDAQVVASANSYRGFPINESGELEQTVILKMHGAVDGGRDPHAWSNNYVITEDDYIGYMTSAPVEQVVPLQLLAKLRWESHFLFLGYTMRDWNLRVFLQRILGEQRLNSSWAIQRDADRLDTRFWKWMGPDLVQVPLAEYLQELETEIIEFARA